MIYIMNDQYKHIVFMPDWRGEVSNTPDFVNYPHVGLVFYFIIIHDISSNPSPSTDNHLKEASSHWKEKIKITPTMWRNVQLGATRLVSS